LLLIEKQIVGGVELLCDVSRGKVLLLVPLVDRAAIFDIFHGLAHTGSQTTKCFITTRVMWRGLNINVAAFCKNC
jgi:hypothetical protein